MELNRPITIIILIVLTAMLVFLFVLPEFEKSQELQITLAEKHAQYNGQSLYYKNIEKLATDIQNRKEALAKIDSSLPDEFSVAPLIYFFNQKSAETGSVITSVVLLDSAPPTTEKKVRPINFSINLVGTYQSLKSFLMSLERSSRMFEVPIIAFSSSRDQSINPASPNQMYNFRLQVTTYTY